ncbi:MAG: tetratricopeptide repeat protein [Alphaproteobacteria bacterium]|nr:tetratricopeptide repeat protein [Alphaproteobacteria bacterium]
MADDNTKPVELLELALKAKQEGNLTLALKMIDRAIMENREHWYLWATKASFIYASPERFEESERLFLESIRLNPKQAVVRKLLGYLYFQNGRFESAIKQFARSLELEEDFGTLTMMAAAEMNVNVESALEHATRAIELNPEWDQAHAIRDRALEALGR